MGTKACTYHNLISCLCIYEGMCVYMYGYMLFVLRKSWILMFLLDIIRFHCLARLDLGVFFFFFFDEYLGMGMVDGKLLLMIRT